MRNSKKRLLSLALSLVMAFSLTVPALAEEEEEGPLTVEEGVAPISVSFEGVKVDGTAEIFMNYFMPELVEPFETGYQAVKSGTKFTVKHAGTDPSVYVYIFMQRFDLQTEHAKVPVVIDENWEEFEERDYYGKYYGDDTWKVLATRLPEYSSEFSTPDGNGNYWTRVIGTDSASLVAEWEDPYFDEVYPKILTPGDSVTFSLPDTGKDTIYRLYAVAYYSEYVYDYWRYYTIKIDDTLAAAAPAEPAEPSAPAAPTKFTDVAATSPFVAAINWAVEQNITTGLTDTTFGPGQQCNNGQILTFLWRASGSPEPTIDNPFTDSIPASFQKAAVWAYEKGMVSGTTFGSSTPCTRAMTVEYLWKAAGSPAVSKNASFTDVPAGADYAQAVAWAVENGVTSGTGDGSTFSPDATCTRGQIVTFLYRDLA